MRDSRKSDRVLTIVLLILAALIVAMLPELRRYVRISRM
jgi:hypothetical protein